MRVFCQILPVLNLLSLLVASGREPQPGADGWLTNAPPHPEHYRGTTIATNYFGDLRAEVVAGRFRVSCSASNASELSLIESAETPGHWPARDWQSHRMQSNAANWFLELPIGSLHIPVVYFAAAKLSHGTVASPLRLARPGALGMEEVTRFFWPFLEGFEQDVGGWQVQDRAGIHIDSLARDGHAALLVHIPDGGRSMTVTTTRLRGWFLEEHEAQGVGVWIRTKAGTGSAAFSLLANAFTAEQVVARRSEASPVRPQWTKIRLPFESFPKVPLGDVDLFSIELSGLPGTEFLIDDLHLLGRWSNDF
jgi:hypothetical protein